MINAGDAAAALLSRCHEAELVSRRDEEDDKRWDDTLSPSFQAKFGIAWENIQTKKFRATAATVRSVCWVVVVTVFIDVLHVGANPP